MSDSGPIKSIGCNVRRLNSVVFLISIGFSMFWFSGVSRASEMANENILEEIIVTATKTGEVELQKTPVSITAFSNELLGDIKTYSMTELSQYAPNVMFQNEASNFMAFIRGVGSTNVSFGGEQNVGFYLDGLYLDRGDAANVNFYDVERIEILRGPQGTLYGRNTTGGTVNVITKRPVNEPEFKIGVMAGNYSAYKVDATISGPIVKDKVKARLSFSRNKHEGYLKNISTGHDEFEDDYVAFRAALDVEISENLSIQFGGDYFTSDAHVLGEKLVFLGGLPAAFAGMAGISESTLIPADFWERYIDQAQNRDREFYGGYIKAIFRLPRDITLTSISGYRDYHQLDTKGDIDATPLDILLAELDFSTSTYTQELQLTGTTGQLKWVAGVYYMDSTNDYPRVDVHFPFIMPGLMLTRVAELDTKAWAVFGNLNYALTDKVSMEAGLRYSYEEKVLPQGYSQAPNMPFPPFGPLLIQFKDNWSSVTWKFGLNYQATEDALLYASVSRGFKAGSFSVTNPPDQLTVDPEHLTSYELGFKTDWNNNRLRLNGAVFYSDYKDQQVNTFFPPNVTLVANAAQSAIKGGELELMALPLPDLTLSAAVSYLDASYDQYVATDANGQPVDVSGNRMPYAPKWKLNFAAQYVFNTSNNAQITFRGNLNRVDDIYFDHFENEALGQSGYTLIDALIRYEIAGSHWRFELFGKNLTEEEYYTYKRDALGAVAGIVGAPRTIGFQVGYEF